MDKIWEFESDELKNLEDYQRIVDKVFKLHAQLDVLLGPKDVISTAINIPMMVLNFDNAKSLIPIEIRRNTEELGWLYTNGDRSHVWICNKGKFMNRLSLPNFRSVIEAVIKKNGKEETVLPTAYKLYRNNGVEGSIFTFIDDKFLTSNPSVL